jgi:hypothetical protein
MTMMNYKELSNEDKIATIAECNFWSRELAAIEQYIVVLKTNDSTAIADFEALGDHPRRIAENWHHFTRASTVYGFTYVTFNQYGRVECEGFMDCETFYFDCRTKGVSENSLTIGRGPNGKWTLGYSLAASRTGCGSGLSVFSAPHNSRRECLRHGLEAVISWHTKENDAKTAPVIKEAKDMLDEIMGRKPKQLSLF